MASSGETRKQLRISSCELMHLPEASQLRSKKHGNPFLCAAKDVTGFETKSAGKGYRRLKGVRWLKCVQKADGEALQFRM